MAYKHSLIGSLLTTVCAVVGFISFPQLANAAESASFRLYQQYPNDAEGGPSESANFQFGIGRMTGWQFPLVSSSFQLVSTYVPSGGGSSGGGEGSSGGGGDGGGGSGGGHRGKGPVPPQEEPPAKGPVVQQEKPGRPAAPAKPRPGPVPEKVVPSLLIGKGDTDVPMAYSEAEKAAASAGEKLIDRIHFFHLIDVSGQEASARVARPITEQWRFTVLHLLPPAFNSAVVAIFILLFVSMGLGLGVRNAQAIQIHRRKYLFLFFLLFHGGEKEESFVIRDLYPQCRAGKRSRPSLHS